MAARLMMADGVYPMVQTEEGRVLVLGRGGEWEDIEDPRVRARIDAIEIDFDAFREAVEGMGGVVPDFV